MTTAAATPSAWKTSSHSHSNSRSSRPATTPRLSQSMVTPTAQIKTTQLSPTLRSPVVSRDAKVVNASPSYFGYVVGDDSIPADSGPGPHARQNWNVTSDSPRSASRPMNNERNPEFELFRRQSEKSIAFALNSLPSNRPSPSINTTISTRNADNPLSPTSAVSPKTKSISTKDIKDSAGPFFASYDNPFFADAQKQDSPAPMSPRHSISEEKHARLSLPAHELQASLKNLQAQRSDTLPPAPPKEGYAMVGPQEVAQAITSYPNKVLLLDLRVFPQYSASRVKGALNLCIPTTLLKRPAFTVQKLAETFTTEQNRAEFNKWKDAAYIVVYDAASSLPKEAITPFTVLKKFAAEGWKGRGLVLKGGFQAFQKYVPQLVDEGDAVTKGSSSSSSTAPPNQIKLPVAGGCQMPATKNAANPFFANIRQNMDLIDGVGQMPIKKPVGMTEGEERRLPKWLRRAASVSDEGKNVSNNFLDIEKNEQKRMQKALSGCVSYGTPGAGSRSDVQVAGIEKGSKNRYNNIFPFEHTRVKLQNVPSHGCDYVNASYVRAKYSKRSYIATQAPVPATFEDFWRVVWEQDVRVIVMLTAESEGGQVKSHPYWKSGEYGQLKVRLLSEKNTSLLKSSSSKDDKATSRPTLGTRRSTTSNTTPSVEKKFDFSAKDQQGTSSKKEDEQPSVIVRQVTISHSAYPFQPMRQVTQLQYTQWPDFGAPASPTAILGLIEIVNKYQRNVSSPSTSNRPDEPVNEGQKPIIVHCSAGCGRTGTFCTIDSVIDMLKRQRWEFYRQHRKNADAMEVDSEDDWVHRDDIDLVSKAVEDFRKQRLSMVQNLRQFVLCYESILQWIHEETVST